MDACRCLPTPLFDSLESSHIPLGAGGVVRLVGALGRKGQRHVGVTSDRYRTVNRSRGFGGRGQAPGVSS
jgi:hypothetical protein